MPVLSPTRLFTGEDILEGASVRIGGGRITEIMPFAPAGIRLDGLLAPGFIDIQVNGGGGVLFNDAPTAGTLATMAAAHRQFGVTGFMATLISDDRAKAAAAMEAVGEAVNGGVEGLLGLHLEGPWLSEPRRGVHPSRFLRRFDAEDLKLLTRDRNFPLLVTAAPEQIDPADIRSLVAAGVKVSLGHTASSAEEVEAALAAGASGFTHIFNAMPPMEGRKPGAVGAALADSECWAGLILDGIHVHQTAARAAFAAKSAGKLILVSDAMSTVGSKDLSMSLFGENITVSGGALRTASGALAGAHLEMSAATRNAVKLLGATPEEVLRMASLTPAEFLGIAHERGRIAPGFRADLVLLDSDFAALSTWIDGNRVH